jgi:flagellar basal body-associated protein FliL
LERPGTGHATSKATVGGEAHEERAAPNSDTRSLYQQRSTDGRRGVFMSILWIILIIVIVLALLGFLGRGAW